MTQERPPFEQSNHIETGHTNPFATRVNQYLKETSSEREGGVLLPHQVNVFEDLQNFFEVGQTRGYIELPTGTGKTVLFVELSKALLGSETEEKKPKILVVAPTKDLVHQTMGRTGERGYGRFAPELRVGSYFSDTPHQERTGFNVDKYDVVVTTYRSFDILSRQNEYRDATEQDILEGRIKPGDVESIKRLRTGKTLLERFDVIFLDEAHHTFGERVSNLVNSLPENNVVIGFTATPDADEERKLLNNLPNKIHTLELNEAVALGLLAPVTPIGVKSGIKIEGSDLYDELGEFIDDRIAYLSEDPTRNKAIVEAAKVMTERGIGTIISCIAGGEAWHARHIAELAQQQGLRAMAVHSRIPAELRQQIYKRFNNGDIDVLTFIGVLGEGWDSQRAKALINGRPTRSMIVAKQRLGRITRLSGDVAYAIDICDDSESTNPPITVADVLNKGDIPYGATVGIVEDGSDVSETLRLLKERVSTLDSLTNEYQASQVRMAGLQTLDKGVLTDVRGNAEYALPSVVNRNFHGLTDEILAKMEQLSGEVLDKKLAVRGKAVRTIYSTQQVRRLLFALPQVDPNKYYVDKRDTKWISEEGLAQLFGRRFTGLTADRIRALNLGEKAGINWIPVAFKISSKDDPYYRHFRVIKMYDASDESISILSEVLTYYLSRSR